MQEEMQQFVHQEVWKLVPFPEGKTAIGTKWILKNKSDARGIVVRNKATTLVEATTPKSKEEPDEAINIHLYRSMIGSLMYLTASRPNIQFA
ncbi:hypothetical protein Tco_0549679, partial [Tanacetum coccineum]